MSKRYKLLLFIVALLSGCNYSHGQTSHADIRMEELLNNGDLFSLKEQYPQLKDSISIEMLNLIAEARLGVAFNRIESAATALDSLLLFYQEALGVQSSLDMASLRAMNLLNIGRYRYAGQAGEDLINTLKDVVPLKSLYSLMFIERVGKCLANIPAPYLERPLYDVTVPMRRKAIGRGSLIYIPVEVNGVTKNYIFDTGCSFGNFVSEKYAEEVGLKILADSIPVSGMTAGYVKLATADSLKIGELTYHYPVFMVAPPDQVADSSFSFDGVIGYHFIRDAKEVIIDNEARSFIFPYLISSGEPNMFLSSNTPNVRIEYADKPFDIIFDSGNTKSNLGNKFAQLFPDTLSGLAECDTQHGGFGGMTNVRTAALPEFNFLLAGAPVTLYDTEVVKSKPDDQFFGSSLGVDFIMSFKRLTINYENMFVRGE